MARALRLSWPLVLALTSCGTPPLPPLIHIQRGDKSLTVNLTQPDYSRVDAYVLERQQPDGTWAATQTVAPSVRAPDPTELAGGGGNGGGPGPPVAHWTASDVQPGVRTCFRGRAQLGGEESSPTIECAVPVSLPTSLAVAVQGQEVHVSWTAGVGVVSSLMRADATGERGVLSTDEHLTSFVDQPGSGTFRYRFLTSIDAVQFISDAVQVTVP
jgi:hypothetical protein